MFKSMIIKLAVSFCESCDSRSQMLDYDRHRCLHNTMCEMTPTLHAGAGETRLRDWSESLATHRAVKTVNLRRLSMWHGGGWFSERGPRRREPFTRWQPNKRLAEALCPLTSSLRADCVATQLYRSDSQTAGLVIINPSAQRWSLTGQAHLHKP